MVRAQAAEALAVLGPEATSIAVPALIKSLKDPNVIVVDRCISALGAIGPAAKRAVPTLLETLPKQKPAHRIVPVWAIWAIDAQTNLVLQEYMGAIKDKQDSAAVMNSALGLGKMGPAAAPATSVLIELLHDNTQESGARGNAALALGKLGIPSEFIRSNLTLAAKAVDPRIRLNAAYALWRLDPQSASNLVQTASQCLKEPSPVDNSAAYFLGEMGKEAQMAVPALREALQKSSPALKRTAAAALDKIQTESGAKADSR